ncbi:MAG: hypothetical protein U0T75_03410 [Chitinophagales bacterium]
MKKVGIIVLVAFAILVQFTSCSKCYKCDFGNSDVREYCPKDFPDKSAGLKMTIDAYEAQGYKCTAQ